MDSDLQIEPRHVPHGGNHTQNAASTANPLPLSHLLPILLIFALLFNFPLTAHAQSFNPARELPSSEPPAQVATTRDEDHALQPLPRIASTPLLTDRAQIPRSPDPDTDSSPDAYFPHDENSPLAPRRIIINHHHNAAPPSSPRPFSSPLSTSALLPIILILLALLSSTTHALPHPLADQRAAALDSAAWGGATHIDGKQSEEAWAGGKGIQRRRHMMHISTNSGRAIADEEERALWGAGPHVEGESESEESWAGEIGTIQKRAATLLIEDEAEASKSNALEEAEVEGAFNLQRSMIEVEGKEVACSACRRMPAPEEEGDGGDEDIKSYKDKRNLYENKEQGNSEIKTYREKRNANALPDGGEGDDSTNIKTTYREKRNLYENEEKEKENSDPSIKPYKHKHKQLNRNAHAYGPSGNIGGEYEYVDRTFTPKPKHKGKQRDAHAYGPEPEPEGEGEGNIGSDGYGSADLTINGNGLS
ncbi:MAG: hypothetical protein Q9227_008652 [Pyrenula ochraceoflavens]